MNEPLTQREFDTWRETDSLFKQQMLAHISNQTETNFGVERRVSMLEAHKDKSNTRVSVISSLVSAVVGGIVGAFTGRG